MKTVLREIYGAGIIFFYYFKWPMVIGYPALIYGAGYPRYWVMDILWIYCVALIIKDFIYKFILKKSYCKDGKASCSRDNKS